MAGNRKLSRTSAQRKALIRAQVTSLIANGKIVTTEAKAKEVRKVAEGLIALAVKEKDNFEEVTVQAKVPVKQERQAFKTSRKKKNAGSSLFCKGCSYTGSRQKEEYKGC